MHKNRMLIPRYADIGQDYGSVLMKIIKAFNKKNILIIAVAVIVCAVIMGAVLVLVTDSGSRADQKRARQLSADAENELANLKKDIPEPDRDTFITVGDKVVVGFVTIKSLKLGYPVLNVFNDNTYRYSLCRNGDGMPWDIEGMTIYGIDSFTDTLEDIKEGDTLIFEDLAGEKHEYIYKIQNEADNNINEVIDYGINICNVDKNGNVKRSFCFVKR